MDRAALQVCGPLDLQGEHMKCWMVHDGEPAYGCQMVLAETRSRAKQVGINNYPGDMGEWIGVLAWRMPEFDGLRDHECAVMDNDELPPGKSFYSEVIG